MIKETLTDGGIYHVSCPKFNVAIWTGSEFKGPQLVDGTWQFETAKSYEEGLPEGVVMVGELLSVVHVKSPYDGGNLLAALIALSNVLFGGI